MPTLSFDAGTLLLGGISTRSLSQSRGGDSVPWILDSRVGKWRCDAIHYSSELTRLRQAGFNLVNQIPEWNRVSWPNVQLHALRDEQEAAQAAWMKTRRGCVVMPTGTGKTEVALSIMQETAVATLVVAPVRDLMYQWHRRILQSLSYDAGVIGDNVFRVRPVSVTTYDSACIHMDKLGNQFGLLIFDECHHLPGQMRRDAARMSAAPMRLGLTATPERSDGRHVDLEQLVGPIVYRSEISEVKESGKGVRNRFYDCQDLFRMRVVKRGLR